MTIPEPIQILLVDGDEDDAQIVESYLREGFGPGLPTLSHALSAREALSRIASEPPDLIVVDQQLQGGDGVSFLRGLRAFGISAPVLYLCGAGAGDLELDALRAGATETVAKPTLTGAGLAAAARHAIGVHRAEQRRHDAEQALRRSEVYYRALIDHSLDLIIILDERAAVRFASAASERLLGYPPEELTGRSAVELVHPEDRAEVQQALGHAVARRGLTPLLGIRVRHRDGSYRDMEAVGASRFDDPVIGGLILSARDVSERRQTEKALRESEERYRRLVDLLPDALMVHHEGRFSFLNPAALHLLGASREEDLLGTPILERVHPDDRSRVVERVARISEAGEAVPLIEEKFIRLDGSTVDVEVAAIPFLAGGRRGVQVVARDFSERKRAEEALRESEERFRATFDQATVGIAQTGPDGTLILVNRRLAEILGYEVEELRGINFTTVTHGDDVTRSLDASQALLEGRLERWRTEKRYIRKDGATVWCQLTVSPVCQRPGEVKYFVAVLQDISDRKAAEEALRTSERLHRALIERAHDIITILEPDGSIRYESPSVERHLGWRPGELVGANVLTFVHAEDLPVVAGRLQEGVARPGSVFTAELRFRHKDGTYRWLESVATFALDDPAIHGVVVNSRLFERPERL